MSKEFRPIKKAPLYEIDKEGNIQKIDGKTPAIPYPRGSRNVILSLDGGKRQTFILDTLIEEAFGEKKEAVAEEESVNEAPIKEEEIVVAPEPLEEEFHAQVQEEEKEAQEEKILEEGNIIRDTGTTNLDGIIAVDVTEEIKIEKKSKAEKSVNTTGKKETRGRKPKPKAPKTDFSDNEMVMKIMGLNTFDSVKIWKLHKNGVSNAHITELVDALHETVIVKTLEQYNQKEKLRNRADKVIV